MPNLAMLQTMNILLLEDDLHIRAFLKEILKHPHWRCFETPSAEYGLDLLKRYEFALVMIDLRLYETSQRESLERLRMSLDALGIPTLFITTTSGNYQWLLESEDSHTIDFIFTPLRPELVKNRVATFLELYRQRKKVEHQTQELQDTQDLQFLLSDSLIQTAGNLKESNQHLDISPEQLKHSYYELERLHKLFRSFVPKEYLQRTLAKQSVLPGEYHEEHLSVFFMDIRNYMQHSEKLGPEEQFEFLNTFFNMVSPPISNSHGFIDKFIGGSFLALFDEVESAQHAVKAAVEMQIALAHHNVLRQKQELAPIQIGIGIDTGLVMVGTLGNTLRFNTSVLGDRVNRTARLEETTKLFQAHVLITEQTYRQLKSENFYIRHLGYHKLRGASKAIRLYEVFDSNPLPLREIKQATKLQLEQGIELYGQRCFNDALEWFQQVLQVFPKDPVALAYAKCCHYYQKHTPDEIPWDRSLGDADKFIDRDIRRRTPRYDVCVPIQIYPNGSQAPLMGQSKDVSVEGVRLQVNHILEVGNVLSVEVTVPSTHGQSNTVSSSYEMLCQVVWQRASQARSQQTWEIGLQRISMPLEQENRWKQFLQNLS